MASFENRNGKIRVRIRLNGVNKTATFDKKSDATLWAKRIEAQILDGKHGLTPKFVLFGDLIKKYLVQETPKKRGCRAEQYRLKRILKSKLADIPITHLTSTDFAIWRDNRLKEVSPDSVRRELESLSSICNIAFKEWGFLKENPVLQISRPKTSKPRSRRPTDDEIIAICEALGYDDETNITTISQRVAIIVLFAIETAMRSGEICGLEWNDIDFKRRVAHLSLTKNGSARDVPLSKRALYLLDKVKGIDKISVFAVDNNTRDTLFRRARDSANIKDLHFHDLRREALTRMAKKVAVHDLAKISGHKDLKILLNTYYNPDISNLADLLD